MSQQREIELLVTERKIARNLGEDESPSKMAEKRKRERILSFLFAIQLILCPRFEQGGQRGNFLASPHRKELGG